MADEKGEGRDKGATAPESPLAVEVAKFSRAMGGLFIAYPALNIILSGLGVAADREASHFAKQHGDEVAAKDEGGPQFRFGPHHVPRAATLMKRRALLGAAIEIVPSSGLVLMVSQFDVFLYRLLRQLFTMRADLLDVSEKPLTLADFQRLGTVDAARAALIDRELDSRMRGSHAELYKWMEGRFGVSLSGDKGLWRKFIECTERRNLYTHSDGVVSDQYLNVCAEHEVPLDTDLVVGRRLEFGPTYFVQAHGCLLLYGVLTAQVLWRKTLPGACAAADSSLVNMAVELIKDGRLDVARALLQYGCEDVKKPSSDRYRRLFTINLAQACKWAGQEVECIKVLDSLDWSASGRDLLLGEAVLRDDFVKAIKLVNAIGKSGEVPQLAYRTWPIFKEFRRRPEFIEAYRQVFGEEFSEVEFSAGLPQDDSGLMREFMQTLDPTLRRWVRSLGGGLGRGREKKEDERTDGDEG